MVDIFWPTSLIPFFFWGGEGQKPLHFFVFDDSCGTNNNHLWGLTQGSDAHVSPQSPKGNTLNRSTRAPQREMVRVRVQGGLALLIFVQHIVLPNQAGRTRRHTCASPNKHLWFCLYSLILQSSYLISQLSIQNLPNQLISQLGHTNYAHCTFNIYQSAISTPSSANCC